MATKNKTIFRRASIVEKNKPKQNNKKNNKPSEEEEECSICQDVLNDGQPVTKLRNCNHKFHKQCIHGWITSGRIASNTCPNCRNVIDINQFRTAQQQFTPEEEIAYSRLLKIKDYERDIGSPVPFLGIVICYDGKILKKMLNIDFNLNLTTNNTFGQLKERILHIQDDIIAELPYDYTCIARNVASTITRGLIQRSNSRTIEIQNIHFTTPSKCSIPEFSNIDFNNNNDMTLGELYKLYQEMAGWYYRDNESIRNVYDNFYYRWEPTFPGDPGESRTDFFVNQDGNELPRQFREQSDNVYSSRVSIAWIGIDIGCNRSGGNTRKKQFRKRNKSIKRKSIKSLHFYTFSHSKRPLPKGGKL